MTNKRVEEYWCINATTYAILNKNVNAAIASGYTLYGDVGLQTVVKNGAMSMQLVQTVVKYKHRWWELWKH